MIHSTWMMDWLVVSPLKKWSSCESSYKNYSLVENYCSRSGDQTVQQSYKTFHHNLATGRRIFQDSWNRVEFWLMSHDYWSSTAHGRILVSDIAKTFDVLGWFSPTIVKVKILLQRLWKCSCVNCYLQNKGCGPQKIDNPLDWSYVVLISFLHHVRDVLSIPLTDVYWWTDSTIVLSWMSGNWNICWRERHQSSCFSRTQDTHPLYRSLFKLHSTKAYHFVDVLIHRQLLWRPK